MKYKMIIALCMLWMGVMGAEAKTLEVRVKKPGTLENYWGQLTHAERLKIDRVVLHGELNDDDCHTLRQMCGNGREQQRTRYAVKYVNLENAAFVEGGSKGYISHYGMRRIYSGQRYKIPNFLFRNTMVEEVVLPKLTDCIGAGAFEFSNLKRIVLPSSVHVIDMWAFKDCWMLKDVVVEGDLDVIDEQAFYGLDSIEMMVFNRVVNVATDCIGYCEKLEKITFNGPVTQIGLKAIANCPNLKFVNFKQGLESKQEPVHSNCPMLNGLNVISKKQGQDDSFEYKIY